MNKLDMYHRGTGVSAKTSKFSTNSQSKTTLNHNIEEINSMRNTHSQSSPSRINGFKIEDYQIYLNKRLKCITDLHSSMKTNLDKFTNLVNECQSDYLGNDDADYVSSRKDILKSISDLSLQSFQVGFSQHKIRNGSFCSGNSKGYFPFFFLKFF